MVLQLILIDCYKLIQEKIHTEYTVSIEGFKQNFKEKITQIMQ